MARNTIEFSAGVVLPPDRREPRGAAPHDVGRLRDGLDIVHGRRAAVETHVGWEWRLEPRLAFLALEAFKQRGFLAADVGAGAVVHVHLVIIARAAGILAEQPGFVGLIDRGL